MRFLSLAALAASVAIPVQAHLGGPMSSVAADKAKIATRMNAVAMQGYTRHDMIRPNGGAVREYTNADGVVFAISWAGPGKPDLRTLLGQYFGAFQQRGGSPGRHMRANVAAPQTARADLEIQSGGHMGWFQGVAFVKSLAPAGFSANDAMVQP